MAFAPEVIRSNCSHYPVLDLSKSSTSQKSEYFRVYTHKSEAELPSLLGTPSNYLSLHSYDFLILISVSVSVERRPGLRVQ